MPTINAPAGRGTLLSQPDPLVVPAGLAPEEEAERHQDQGGGSQEAGHGGGAGEQTVGGRLQGPAEHRHQPQGLRGGL